MDVCGTAFESNVQNKATRTLLSERICLGYPTKSDLCVVGIRIHPFIPIIAEALLAECVFPVGYTLVNMLETFSFSVDSSDV